MSRDFDYLAKEKEKKKDKKNVEISTFNVNVKKLKQADKIGLRLSFIFFLSLVETTILGYVPHKVYSFLGD